MEDIICFKYKKEFKLIEVSEETASLQNCLMVIKRMTVIDLICTYSTLFIKF